MPSPDADDREYRYFVMANTMDDPGSDILTIGGRPVIGMFEDREDAEKVRQLDPENRLLHEYSQDTLSMGTTFEDVERAIRNARETDRGWLSRDS